ncbi:MAG: FAD-dependent oxidoreductase [Pseudazoarcus pumilus]|nr:FAD-dependent oxidoreductase [Pseudazoarcus pumilus]
MTRTVLIIGAGLAGYNLARELRKLDQDCRLVIISRDAADFYSKPMLSNALSSGKTAASLVMKSCEQMADELNADIRPRTDVHSIDVAERKVRLSDGSGIRWDELVLAVGADPVRLPLEGDGADEVLSVNDLDDFARFTDRLVDARKVVLLGGGLIGCEFANDLLARNIRPTVVDLADRPLGRLLPPEAAAFFSQRMESAGVLFRLEAKVNAVHKADGGYRVRVADGSTLNADVVVSAVGLRPRTALAEQAGCKLARGIVTDRQLATSVPHIHALGDCAEVEGLNLPFVMPLMHQARALAATLAGTPTAVQYPAMPVLVKTPACPTVVCPPPAGAAGDWRVERDDEGVCALFEDSAGELLGFALLGKATARRQELAARVPRPFSG